MLSISLWMYICLAAAVPKYLSFASFSKVYYLSLLYEFTTLYFIGKVFTKEQKTALT
jgi:hypothetical protein